MIDDERHGGVEGRKPVGEFLRYPVWELPPNDPHYPHRFRLRPAGAETVYACGAPPESLLGIQTPVLAVIGSRARRGYTEEFGPIRQLTGGLVAATCEQAEKTGRRLTLVSGAALGVDMAAQRRLLRYSGAGLHTVAIYGRAFDNIAYDEQEELARLILDADGSILTFQPLGSKKVDHLHRNDYIIEAADVVVGVAGLTDSGTHQAMKIAAERGKKMLVVDNPVITPPYNGLLTECAPGKSLEKAQTIQTSADLFPFLFA